MEARERRVGMGRRKEDMEEVAATITEALDSEIIHIIDLINELLKLTGAKICITVDKEPLTIANPEGEREWIAYLRTEGEEIVMIKAETPEPFTKESPMEIEATGIFFDSSKSEIGFFIE